MPLSSEIKPHIGRKSRFFHTRAFNAPDPDYGNLEISATLKSIDYNVAMTFILNNNNNPKFRIRIPDLFLFQHLALAEVCAL